MPMRVSGPTPFPPPPPQAGLPQHLAFPPSAKEHPSVTVQMSPRNLILGGSVLAFLLLIAAAFAIFHTMSGPDTSSNPFRNNGSFPGSATPDANGGFPGSTTTTDSNGNSVTMGPGAHTVQNPDGSTTTTDANGNSSTQGGSGSDSGPAQGAPGQQQNPFMNNGNFPQPQQGGQQQQDGFPQQQQQQGSPQQQQGGFNPQQGFPQQQQQQGGYPQQ